MSRIEEQFFSSRRRSLEIVFLCAAVFVIFLQYFQPSAMSCLRTKTMRASSTTPLSANVLSSSSSRPLYMLRGRKRLRKS